MSRTSMDNPERVHWVIAGISILALVLSIISCINTEKWNEGNIYISIVQSRIETCMGLSRHHYDINSDSNIETNKGRRETTNRDRGDKAVGMARALTLCLAKHTEIEGIKKCVQDVNNRPNFLVHDILSSGQELEPPTGNDHLIC